MIKEQLSIYQNDPLTTKHPASLYYRPADVTDAHARELTVPCVRTDQYLYEYMMIDLCKAYNVAHYNRSVKMMHPFDSY